MGERERVFTTFQVAEMCSVRPTTVIKWANQHRIKVYTTPGGHRRVRETDFMEFLRKYKLPIPTEMKDSRRRVVVVEDEADLGQLISRALQRATKDIDLFWTRDGVEALLEVGKQPPDLMILDVAMPLLDGARVLATLKADAKTQNIRVIGMTGQRLAAERQEYMRKTCDAFYLKPFKINDLVQRALQLLDLRPTEKGRPASSRSGPA